VQKITDFYGFCKEPSAPLFAIVANRIVSSNFTPPATIASRTALSREFAGRKREEFAASWDRPLHLGTRL